MRTHSTTVNGWTLLSSATLTYDRRQYLPLLYAMRGLELGVFAVPRDSGSVMLTYR